MFFRALDFEIPSSFVIRATSLPSASSLNPNQYSEFQGMSMNGHRSLLMLITVAGLFALCGASCPSFLRQKQQALPPVLPPNPSWEQVVEVVNRNNGQIQSFSTNQASLTTPGAPTLRANVAFQRPMCLRLHGTYGLTGSELDLGSNNAEFWFWVRRNEPQAVYFCRHDQFAASPARQMVPIQPDWLIDALGVSTFDTSLPIQGPFPQPDGHLEIRTIKETADGPVTKLTHVDASQGWVMEQTIVNAQGLELVRSEASGYRRDPRSGLWTPRYVKLTCPTANFQMQLDLGNVEINVPSSSPAETFTRPALQNAPPVDLSNPNFRPESIAGVR
jgi:hypothetical protein